MASICVASAGNDGQAIQVWPASYGSVMGVASTSNQMIRSLFSNYGNSLVALAAPGEGVITLYPKEHYAQVWGTSFSAPWVSGAAALLLDINNKMDGGTALRLCPMPRDRAGTGSGRTGPLPGGPGRQEEIVRDLSSALYDGRRLSAAVGAWSVGGCPGTSRVGAVKDLE